MEDSTNKRDIRVKGVVQFPGQELRCAPTCPSPIYRDDEWDSIDAAGAAFAALSAIGALLLLATLLMDREATEGPPKAWAPVPEQRGDEVFRR